MTLPITRPPFHQLRELTVPAGTLVVQAEILEDLHETLLLPGGLELPVREGGCLEKLLTGQTQYAVARRGPK